MFVLPDAGSELPADSDRADVVCAAPVDEAVENALDVVGDEHSMIGDFVQPDSVLVVQAYMSTDVCGDDRFSPGVTDCALLDRLKDLDSHGEVLWECLSVSGDSSVACLSDWMSVLRLVALMTGSPQFPDTGDPDFCLRILISRVDFSDVGRHCAMDFSARKMCPRAWMPDIGLRMFAQTLPALPVRQEWPVREVLAGVEGFSGASPEGVVRKSPPARASLSARKTGLFKTGR